MTISKTVSCIVENATLQNNAKSDYSAKTPSNSASASVKKRRSRDRRQKEQNRSESRESID